MKIKELIHRLESVPDTDLDIYFSNGNHHSKYDFSYLTYDQGQNIYFICFDENKKLSCKNEST